HALRCKNLPREFGSSKSTAEPRRISREAQTTNTRHRGTCRSGPVAAENVRKPLGGLVISEAVKRRRYIDADAVEVLNAPPRQVKLKFPVTMESAEAARTHKQTATSARNANFDFIGSPGLRSPGHTSGTPLHRYTV